MSLEFAVSGSAVRRFRPGTGLWVLVALPGACRSSGSLRGSEGLTEVASPAEAALGRAEITLPCRVRKTPEQKLEWGFFPPP